MDEGSSHMVAAWNHFHCFRLGALVSVRHLSRSHSTQTKIIKKCSVAWLLGQQAAADFDPVHRSRSMGTGQS